MMVDNVANARRAIYNMKSASSTPDFSIMKRACDLCRTSSQAHRGKDRNGNCYPRKVPYQAFLQVHTTYTIRPTKVLLKF